MIYLTLDTSIWTSFLSLFSPQPNSQFSPFSL
jgi:hypothetical protein